MLIATTIRVLSSSIKIVRLNLANMLHSAIFPSDSYNVMTV